MNDGKLHISSLKRMGQTPMHYLYWQEHEFQQTPAMRNGSLVHALVLGGSYTVYDGERRGKAWAQFAEDHATDRLIVTVAELERAVLAAYAIIRNLAQIEVAGIGPGTELLKGRKEHAIEWAFRGVPAHSTLDVLGPGRVVDLKICTPSVMDPSRWWRHAAAQGWHAQFAFYREAAAHEFEAANGPVPNAWRCYAIAAESKPPHAVVVHRLSERALTKGLQACIAWTERLSVCTASGQWPGYAQSDVEWDIPDEAEIDFEGTEEGE